MFDFIGEHLGEVAAVLAVLVSAYTAWSKRKHDKEAEQNDDGRLTAEMGDSLLKLIQPLNERIDELVSCQDNYIESINSAIVVLKECRSKLDNSLSELESFRVDRVEGTRTIVKELQAKVK